MMTMISREAAIKMIQSMTGDKSDVYSMAMADAADALSSLPAVVGVVVPREPTKQMADAGRKALRILASLLSVLVVIGGFWFAGFDFSKRGEQAFTCYAVSLIAIAMTYFYPGWGKA